MSLIGNVLSNYFQYTSPTLKPSMVKCFQSNSRDKGEDIKLVLTTTLWKCLEIVP